MPRLIPASYDAVLTWDYEADGRGLTALYDKSKKAQWNATTDIDWSIPVPYGQPLPESSAFGLESFQRSPFRSRGIEAWDAFRWEFQNWMVSQFLHGEQGAMISAARLAEAMPDLDCKLYASTQAMDEARHVEAFSRYLREHIPDRYTVSGPLDALMQDLLGDSRWDITALGMQILIEALAMAAFRTANAVFNDELIKQISMMVARDEARHLSFGIMSLKVVYPELSAAELAEREDFVLEAAHLMRRRFLLEDVWERMDVPSAEGMDFALSDPVMSAYRQTIFAKIVSALAQIGLMTKRVRSTLISLELLDPRRQISRAGISSS